jgi:hypothetical protein
MISKEYMKSGGVYKVQTFRTTQMRKKIDNSSDLIHPKLDFFSNCYNIIIILMRFAGYLRGKKKPTCPSGHPSA